MHENNNSWRDLNSCFHFICICVTISVVCYCFYQYSLDEDVSLIDFKIFHDDENSLYPTTTLCFYNPFLESELIKYGEGINTTSYSKFLQGELQDERMAAIDYDKVTISLADKLISVSGKMENGTFLWLYDRENKHPAFLGPDGKDMTYTSFKSGLNKCFSFEIPYIKGNLMWSLFIKMKLDSFPRNLRDNEIRFKGNNSTQGGFKVSFHYPFQRFHSSGAAKYQWNALTQNQRQEMPCRGFYMRFRIKGVEVLARRNKRRSECNTDWLSSDDMLQNNIMRQLKCHPPYMQSGVKGDNQSSSSPMRGFSDKEWVALMDYPSCTNRKDIESITDPTNDDLQKYPKPCRIIEKLGFDYDEGFENVLKKEDIPCNSTENAYFTIRVYFGETTYKEIQQVRDINIEGLAGNISGYIGFILGYSILQLPGLLLLIKRISKIYWANYAPAYPHLEATPRKSSSLEKLKVRMLANEKSGDA